MASEIGLKATLQPELDRTAVRREADQLRDEMSRATTGLNPFGGRGGGGGFRERARGAAGTAARVGGQVAVTRGLRALGVPAAVTPNSLFGAGRGGGGAGGGAAVGGTTAGEPGQAVPLMQAQLAVQEEMLEELEDIADFTAPGDQSDVIPRRLGGSGGGGGMFGGMLGGAVTGGAIGLLGLITTMEEFSWPDLPDWTWPELPTWTWPELPTWTWPEVPEPDWTPIPVAEPTDINDRVSEPNYTTPTETPAPTEDPFGERISRPNYTTPGDPTENPEDQPDIPPVTDPFGDPLVSPEDIAAGGLAAGSAYALYRGTISRTGGTTGGTGLGFPSVVPGAVNLLDQLFPYEEAQRGSGGPVGGPTPMAMTPNPEMFTGDGNNRNQGPLVDATFRMPITVDPSSLNQLRTEIDRKVNEEVSSQVAQLESDLRNLVDGFGP